MVPGTWLRSRNQRNCLNDMSGAFTNGHQSSLTIIPLSQGLKIDAGSRGSSSMNFGFAAIRPGSSKTATETGLPGSGSLNGHCLPHDRTSSSNDLQIGDGPPTRRSMTRGGGEGAESLWRCGFEKRAH